VVSNPKKLKILLIEPPFLRFMGFKCDWFPLGLGYIAAVLKSNGFSVKIYNAEFHQEPQYLQYSKIIEKYKEYSSGMVNEDHPLWQEVRKVIKEVQPDVVGITIKTSKLGSATMVANICKMISKDIVVVAGGAHCTALPEETLSVENIDFVVRGEGEFTFLELLEHLENNKPLESIDGLSYRKGSVVSNNKNRALIDNLDRLPVPDRDCLINFESYDKEAFGDIVTSRGCPFRCSYCAAHLTWTRKMRYRSIENIVEEIKLIIATYGRRQFMFWDDSFTMEKKRIIKFCSILREKKIDIRWGCCTRFDLLDEEVLRAMKKSGCCNIELGVESGSPRILKLMEKDVTKEKIKSKVELLRKYRIYWSGFFMIGLPTEKPEDIRMTVDFMNELKPNYATFSIFTPLPGTELYEFSKKEGIIKGHLDWFLYSYQSQNNNFTGGIDNEAFRKIVFEVSREFDVNNKHFRNILKKALTRMRIYCFNPAEFVKDALNYLNYLGVIKINIRNSAQR
jgi:radical SAM superfamily enzyme YgiQ (UPF0313 family)